MGSEKSYSPQQRDAGGESAPRRQTGGRYKKLRREVGLPIERIARRDCMETVKVTVKSDEKASRLELFIRFIWGTIVMIILSIIGIFAGIAMFVQWFYILILGKRHAALAKFINAWLVAMTGLYFYLDLSTDERPALMPQF